MNNLECYLASISMIKKMRNLGVINEKEYNKAELFLREKYCIKNVSLFRPYDLIKSPFRVINVCD